MPESARQPEPQRSVTGGVPGNGRNPDGTFAVGNKMPPRGPDKGPRKSILRAVLLQALAGEQWRGKGKSKQLVKAAAMLDIVEQYQKLFRGKGGPRYFLAAAEQVREVLDDDSESGAQARRAVFILSGDYHDQRQVHVHPGEGPESVPSAPPPVPREPLRDANGNVFEALEPFE